jgi:hypothetical protein
MVASALTSEVATKVFSGYNGILLRFSQIAHGVENQAFLQFKWAFFPLTNGVASGVAT